MILATFARKLTAKFSMDSRNLQNWLTLFLAGGLISSRLEWRQSVGFTSRILIDSSALADAIIFPSALNAILKTGAMRLPDTGRCKPVVVFHN
jgi:hypothetical protein